MEQPDIEHADRKLWSALCNGMRARCPRCGEGRLFRGYLKIADRCKHCGLDLRHARADDLPAYIAITIVGHILVVGLMHFGSEGGGVEPWVYLAILSALAIILPMALLPSIKGAVIGLQWANRMHGF